jgi:alpha/beta superfamily hydrolase
VVTPGQFLERPTLIPAGSEVMEGLWHRGHRRPPVLILPPLPADGGSMDHVVAAEVAWAAATRGFPTLRFNYRGLGASQGERSAGRALDEDAEAAWVVLEENTSAEAPYVVAVGGSAQVALGLMRRHPALAGMCWVSPTELDVQEVLEVSVPLLVVVGALDLRQPRVALSAALAEAGARFELVEGADAAFTRHLVQVGHLVAEHLQALEITSK